MRLCKKHERESGVICNLKILNMKFDKKEVDHLFQKIDAGIWEYRKAIAIDVLKLAWTIIWTVTIFPLLILRDWFFSDCK